MSDYLKKMHEIKCNLEKRAKNLSDETSLNADLKDKTELGCNKYNRDPSQSTQSNTVLTDETQTLQIKQSEEKVPHFNDDFNNVLNRIRQRQAEIKLHSMKFNKVDNISDGNKSEVNDCKPNLEDNIGPKEENLNDKEKNSFILRETPANEIDDKNFDKTFEDNFVQTTEKNVKKEIQENKDKNINIDSPKSNENFNTINLDIHRNQDSNPNKTTDIQVEVNTICYNNEVVSPIKNKELSLSESDRESDKEIDDSIVVDSSRLFSNEIIPNTQIFSGEKSIEKNETKISKTDGKLNINELSIENPDENKNENKYSPENKTSSGGKLIDQTQIHVKQPQSINTDRNRERDKPDSNKNLPNINKNSVVSVNAQKNLDQSVFSSKMTKYTPNPTHVDSDFLQKVEISLQQNEKDKEYLLEKEELQAIESSLPIDQRLLHQKWQIRKNAYKEVSEIIASSENDSEIFETFSPWLKYFLSETNVIALVESLNTFYTFNKYSSEHRSKLMIDLFDELEKLLNHFKQNLNEVCHKLILLYLNTKKMFNSTFNEILKKLNSTNLKLINFMQKIILDLLNEKIDSQIGNDKNPTKCEKNQINQINQTTSNQTAIGALSENYIKILLEKSILYYSTSSKNIEKKKIFAKLISEIYSVLEDSYHVIRKNVNVINFNDLEKLFKSVKKRKDISKRFIIYNETFDIIQSGGGNKLSDQEDEEEVAGMSHMNPGNVINEEKYSKNSKNLNEKNSKIPGHNISSPSHSPSEANDIISALPDDFYEIPYVNHFNQKKEILEKAYKILSNLQTIKDKEKDHREVLSSLNYAIDDSNVLVHSEGIRCLNHIARLLKYSINQSKLKLLLLSSFDKFKDKKSLVKIELYSLYDSIILNSCFVNGIEYFLNFILQFIQNQKNPVIKQSLLEYLTILFSEDQKDESDFPNTNVKTMINNIEDISYVNFSKLLADAMPHETQSGVKDLCTDLILIFKNKTTKRGRSGNKHIEEKFKKIIDTLPSYRKNLIAKGNSITGRSISNSRGISISTEISEREYKAGLKKIKSNINVRCTSTSNEVNRGNRFNTEKSEKNENTAKDVSNLQQKLKEKNNLQKEKNEKSSSKKKSSVLKFNNGNGKENNLINEKNVDKDNNNANNTLSKKDLLEKMMNKKKTLEKKQKEENNKNEKETSTTSNTTNIKKINTKSNPDSNNTNIKNFPASQPPPSHNAKNNSHSPEEESSFIHTNRSQTTTNISVLEKRMESAIEHIYSLTNHGLFEYTKKVIKDFLIFVKNVTSKKLKEDMESHFQVILKILSKIWERIENAPDELIIQTLKVIIVTPCFIDLDSEHKSDKIDKSLVDRRVFKHYLYPFMEQMRKIINNDEKVFYLYLDILNKFVNNETKSTTFLDHVNPRPSVIMFLNYFLNEENPEKFPIIEMGVENLIYEVIEKSSFLSEYEKSEFYKILESTSDKVGPDHHDESGCEEDENLNSNLKSSLIENLGREDQLEEEEISDACNLPHRMQNQEIIQLAGNKQEDVIVLKNTDKYLESENILQQHIDENEKLKERLNSIVQAKQKFTSKDQLEKGNDKPFSSVHDQENSQMKPSNTDISISHINASINEDIQDIKEKLKQKMRKLDMNIQRIESKTKAKEEVSFNNNNFSQNKTENLSNENYIIANSSNNKTLLDESISNNISILNNKKTNGNNLIRNLQDFCEEENQEKGKYHSNSINLPNQVVSNQNYQNTNYFSNPLNEDNAKALILKIPSNLLDDNICEIALYVKLESLYQKSNSENKLMFTNELKLVLENNQMIKTSSFNCFLQLFEFLLNLLTHEIILNNDAGNRIHHKQHNSTNIYNPSAMISLQEIIENTIKKKPMTEIFKVLIYLLRKYLPRDFNYMIDKLSVVYLKTISYLIKLCLDNKSKYNPEFNMELRCYDILHEINELFVTYPPSGLKEGVPNLDLLDKIYRQLRILTDVSINSDLVQAKLFIENSKKRNKTNYCQDYMQYLISIINN